jgi:hypothetical protein
MEIWDYWWREIRIDFADYYSENEKEFFIRNSKNSTNESSLTVKDAKVTMILMIKYTLVLVLMIITFTVARSILRLLMIQYRKMIMGWSWSKKWNLLYQRARMHSSWKRNHKWFEGLKTDKANRKERKLLRMSWNNKKRMNSNGK